MALESLGSMVEGTCRAPASHFFRGVALGPGEPRQSRWRFGMAKFARRNLGGGSLRCEGSAMFAREAKALLVLGRSLQVTLARLRRYACTLARPGWGQLFVGSRAPQHAWLFA